MRHYATNSPHAAGRLLALTMVVDGNVDPTELAALDHARILSQVELDHAAFHDLLQALCEDLVAGASHGVVQLDTPLLDHLLHEIADPKLRRKLLLAMWKIADADGWLADGEAILLARAGVIWGAENGFAVRDRAS